MSEILTGVYGKTLVRDEHDSSTIFSFNPRERVVHRNRYGNITCVGIIPAYTEGMPLEIKGVWEKDHNYGMQLRVIKVKEASTRESTTITYLSSGICKGIGPAIATKIVSKTGADIFGFIKKEKAKEQISEAGGINLTLAGLLISAIESSVAQREVFQYISEFGGTYASAVEICKTFSDPLRKLKENPYLVGSTCRLPFAICDAIGKKQEIPPTAKPRLGSLLYEAMLKTLNNGHTYTSLAGLYNESKKIIKQSAYKEIIPAGLLLSTIVQDKRFIIEKVNPRCRIYLRKIWEAEQVIIKEKDRLNNSKKRLRYTCDLIKTAERDCNIIYGESQKQAFGVLKETGLKIITGGPGTGKTTTINGIITAYKLMHPEKTIACCAPTGRAAQRMSASTGMPASTIHRLIEYQPYGESTNHKDANNPIMADMIVVDEFSMVDTELFAMLLSAIKNGSLVLIIGDPNQLPSVGSGNLLHDFINSKKIECHALDTVYRQKSESKIIANSIKVNSGQTDLEQGPDFEIFNFKNEDDIREKVKDIVNEYYDAKNPYDLQFLTSTHKSSIGNFAINKLIQGLVNKETKKLVHNSSFYKKHDKVIMLKNNYDKNYFNGDIGTITKVSDMGLEIDINNKIHQIEKSLMQDISLAYCMTIHKSQGSEFPVVVVILPKNPKIMLKRNLLHTALTRAKQKVIVLTVDDALEIAIKNTIIDKRNTGMKDLLENKDHKIIPRIDNSGKYIMPSA